MPSQILPDHPAKPKVLCLRLASTACCQQGLLHPCHGLLRKACSPGLVPSKSFQLAAARPASVADMIQCGAPFKYSTSLRMNTAAQNAQSAARKPRLLALLCALPIAASSCDQSRGR